MKKTTLLGLLLLAFSALFAQNMPKFSRATIFLDGRMTNELSRLGLECDHGAVVPGHSVSNDFSEKEIALARAAGFRVQIEIDDVGAWYREQNEKTADRSPSDCPDFDQKWPTPVNWTLGSMAGYKTWPEVQQELDKMKALFPNLISTKKPLSNTIKTHEGRDVFYVKISDNPEQNEVGEPELFFTAMHHAREPLGMMQLLFFMWHCLENYSTDPEIKAMVDSEALFFVPCVNPDGYEFNRQTNPQGGGFWRKNRRDNLDGERGVDLNRNYGYSWGFDDDGSSPSTGSDVYRGPFGFSEPETQMVRDFCDAHAFRVALNYHTWGNLMIYPWGYSDSDSPDQQTFSRIARWLKKENNYNSGRASETVAYNVNGTTDDWMYGETSSKPAIFAITPEVGRINGFWSPAADINYLCKGTLWQNLTACRFALDAAIFEDRSEAYLPVVLNGKLPFDLHFAGLAGKNYTITAKGLSPKILQTGPAQTISLDGSDAKKAGQIDFLLDPTVELGDPLDFEITISNGLFVDTVLLQKHYGGKLERVFEDDFDGVSNQNWLTASGNWGLTTEDFHSAPNAMTDSPFDYYQQNSVSELYYNQTLPVAANVVSARLRFWGKWAIAARYDYAQILGNDQPLCGQRTNFGSDYQQFGQPVYDGYQKEWIEETVDLTDFAGQSIELVFKMVGNFGQGDGFYFDDFSFEQVLPDGSVSTQLLDEKAFSATARPNPASDRAFVFFEKGAIETEANLLIFNALGEKMDSKKVAPKAAGRLEIETSDWPSGLYFYQIETPGGASPLKKLVVQH